MRILFVSKRFPQGRDLLTRPFGRFFHLPAALAERGHDVRVSLVSHQGATPGSARIEGLEVSATDIRMAPLDCVAGISRDAVQWSPDWVLGCSDAWIGLIAARVARQCHARLALDAYDDFESYMVWNLPLHALWRRALRKADLVTAAGPQLASLLGSHRRRDSSPVVVVPMAADPAFRPMDRQQARVPLGLPEQSPLLGYSGSWSNNRGSHLLVDGFRHLRSLIPDVQLILTGRRPARPIEEEGIRYLGYVEDALLPTVINAMDACAVVTADTRFGRGSYPVKLCEAMACGMPVVATATEPVRWMLGAHAGLATPLGEAKLFGDAAAAALGMGRVGYQTNTWEDSANLLEQALLERSS